MVERGRKCGGEEGGMGKYHEAPVRSRETVRRPSRDLAPCESGKRAFRGRKPARAHAKAMAKRYNEPLKDVYSCGCGYWHLSTPKPRRRP